MEKLPKNTAIYVETQTYAYVIHIIEPGESIVYIQCGREEVDERLWRLISAIEKGDFLRLAGRGALVTSTNIEHATVMGDGVGEHWEYEVF